MLPKGALDGITVLDLSRLLPGPYCSMILADHGARVINIEDRRYMADGHFLPTVSRNKEHMTLDLKTDTGREIFFRLARKADVVLEGFRPGVVERLGVDYEAVREVNPAIIYCSITGYGQTGACRNRVGHDANYLSQAGILDMIGEKDRPPIIPGVQIADIAGGMNGAIGILLALHAREKTGKGQYVDISMTDTMVGFLPVPLFMYQLLGQMPRRGNEFLSQRFAFYNTYETADGRYLSIGALEPRFWRNLCGHLGVPEFIPLQYDEERRGELIDFMRRTFKRKTLAEWQEELADLEICWAPVQNLAEVMADPLFKERKMVVEVEGEGGAKVQAIGVPVKLGRTPGAVRSAPTTFGRDTEAVLRELGYGEAAIAELASNGII